MRTCCMLMAMLLVVLQGCSSVPQATMMKTKPQQKMQAAKHWDILADDVAAKIKAAIDTNPELAGKSVYLETDDSSPFGQSFKEMLKVDLFRKGVLLSDVNSNSIQLRYTTKVLHHNADRTSGDALSSRGMAPGTALLGTGAALGMVAVARAINYSSFAASQATLTNAALAFGAAGLIEMAIASQYTNVTNTEYMFSAEISCAGKTYDMYLDVYYINGEDAYQYMAQINRTHHTSDTVMSGKVLRVVGEDQNKAHAK